MGVGAEIIGKVKTNTKGLCRDTIKNITTYWQGGSYIMLKIKYMVPGERPLIYIVHNITI